MSSGRPDWSKLNEMGKLPKGQRSKVPFLSQLDVAEKRIKELEEEVNRLKGESVEREKNKISDTVSNIEIKCSEEKCEYMAYGRTEGLAKNILRMHGKTHATKE